MLKSRTPTLAALLAALLSPSLQAQERTLEVDDFFSIQRVGAPEVSPDGAWVAYTVSHTSLEKERSFTRSWMASTDGSEVLPLTAEGTSASSPDWSPDGRYLSFLASRGEDETQVWLVDRRGGEAYPLTAIAQGVEGYSWSPTGDRLLLSITDPEDETADEKDNAPDDPWVIDRLQFKQDRTGYLTGSRKTHLYVFDVATKGLRQLTDGPWDEGDATWSPDGTRIAFTSNRTPDPDTNVDTNIWVVDADVATPTSTPRRITTQPGADRSPAWSPDGRSLAFVTTPDVDAMWYATGHLAVVTADGGAPRILTRELDRNVGAPRWSGDGAWIWFGLEDSAENHVARIRPDGSGFERMVAGPVFAGGFDWNGGTFAFQMQTLSNPAEIYLAPFGSGSTGAGARLNAMGSGPGVERLTRLNDTWLDEIRLGETRNIHFPSQDGTEIEGFVAFPPDFQEGRRYPVLLRNHGGPVSQYSHSFNFEAQLFAADGYVVVYTNPRGSSGYGQAFSHILFADWGHKDFEDVMAGVDYVIEQGWGDPDRLGVGGWSYGGILTNYVITQTGRFKGAITGASEVLYIANYGHDHYQQAWEAELGLPWEGDNRANWERISPFNKAHLVTTPTLVMGGEKDWNVPIQNSEQLYQVLRRVGTPTQLVVYPGQSHGISVPSYQKDRFERYLAWYDRYVKQPGAPIS